MDSSSVHSATRADDSYKSHAPEEHGCEISGITLQEEERERSESESESERGAGRRKGLWRERCAGTARTIFHHVKTHTGVGLVCAVAYFDPGNWGVDLQAGSEYGYRLLFVVLLAGLIAVFFQVLASRLGCVTGLDLASHCRLLLHDRPKHTFLYRWLGLYPLYILSETAIIATDLAELLGSAIALCLLFPKLELWHGVLITAFDVVLILALGDPLGGRPVKSFELVIAGLVLAVLVCMCIIIARVDVHWGDAFEGYLPSKYIFPNGALYTSVGILGATVMPHSLFLGSALATQDRITPPSYQDSGPDSKPKGVLASLRTNVINAFRTPPPSEYATNAKSHSERNNNSLAFVKGHLYHGIVDVALSLLGFAVVINSAILILSSAVFFYGDDPRTMGSDKQAGLFDAYDLIKETVGQGAATLFAIALLAAGQSSSIIATVAGQAVSEGFLQWRTSAVVRRLLTRLLAIIPSMAVAIAVGRKGIDILLVTSQVVLCVVLPFISFPLIYLTSKKEVMAVKVPSSRPSLVPSATSSASSSSSTTLHPKETDDVEAEAVELAASGDVATDNAQEEEKMIYFNNGIVTKCIGGAIWILVMTANVYLLATLAMGKGNG
ncbi:transporter protein smf2 [Moniliophthora roreri]|uniref:Natural resistance-associated macrophage protein n=1 Tax=Moniliophthora roreri TaxID=221103 RepID=A0A0W0GD99_MONRR|nr:transporter protein smf2 [Moniliophthora roreri]